MSWGTPGLIIALVAISMGAWVITSWIRAKHGYPLTDDWGNSVNRQDPDTDRRIALLIAENEKLQAMVIRQQERIEVIERIVTDKPTRLAAEIDNLKLGA